MTTTILIILATHLTLMGMVDRWVKHSLLADTIQIRLTNIKMIIAAHALQLMVCIYVVNQYYIPWLTVTHYVLIAYTLYKIKYTAICYRQTKKR